MTRPVLYKYSLYGLMYLLSAKYPNMILPIVLPIPMIDKRKAAALGSSPYSIPRSGRKINGALNPRFVNMFDSKKRRKPQSARSEKSISDLNESVSCSKQVAGCLVLVCGVLT